MDIRYVVRHPHMMTTPKLLRDALGCRLRQWPPRQKKYTPSWNRDFLFKVPEPHELQEAGDYDCLTKAQKLHTFFGANKAQQRAILNASGLPTPWTSTTKNTWSGSSASFVVRPLRHSQGAHYRVTQDPNDFTPGSQYVAELFEKEREYRIVFVYGEALVVLRKHVPDGTPRHLPWNHAVGGTFRTINDVPNSKPFKSGAIEALSVHPVVRAAHIVGVDILWKRPDEWTILEFNAAPSLTIEENVKKVADFIKGYHH